MDDTRTARRRHVEGSGDADTASIEADGNHPAIAASNG